MLAKLRGFSGYFATAFVFFAIGFYDGFQVSDYMHKQDVESNFSRCENKKAVQTFIGYDRSGWVHCFEHRETTKGKDYIKRSVIAEPM